MTIHGCMCGTGAPCPHHSAMVLPPGGTYTPPPYYGTSTTPIWCAVCCRDDPYGNRQLSLTLVGLLWVCGAHVEAALDLQSPRPESIAP